MLLLVDPGVKDSHERRRISTSLQERNYASGNNDCAECAAWGRGDEGDRLAPSPSGTTTGGPGSPKEEFSMTDTFQALGVSEEVCAALAKAAITEPFAVQRLCIPAGLEGADVIAKSPTGSGKTLAFGLPLIMLADPEATAPEALVLCPTRELAQQIGADL